MTWSCTVRAYRLWIHINLFCLILAFFIPFFIFPDPARAKTNAHEKAILERMSQAFKGDLKDIRQRRFLRVLVNYSKTNFFLDGGIPRGFEYELLKNYEKHLNLHLKNQSHRIAVVFIPTPFDQLLTSLLEGRGDIAAAGLTITPQRQKLVQFAHPYIPNVQELVVTNRRLNDIHSLDDLAGRMVFVRSGSSYVTHLEKLNRQLVSKGKKPIHIKQADQHIVTEDILELVNAGAIPVTVADHHIAAAWSQVLPHIVVHNQLAINTGGKIAWAVRKENPDLCRSLNQYIKKNKLGSLLGNILFNRYYTDSKWINNPLEAKERQKLDVFMEIFKKYADEYGFDALAIAAQAYQESGLDHKKKSAAGAIGIMQIMPNTASDKWVDIQDIHLLENNIHAGVKYLNFLRNRYFSDPAIEPAARVDFSWAAYNAGPTKIIILRQKAKQKGFDPNKWFFHVEKIAADLIGRETVDYVANINKYYVAYKLYFQSQKQRSENLP